MFEKSFLIIPAVQLYPWGKPGSSSQVAQLSVNSIPEFQVSDATTYAELWMGTHPKAPTRLTTSTETTLSHWLEQHPELIGTKVRSNFPTPGQLPFLFKVLSVNKSLSIQAHPTKKHAELLHAAKPDKYPDANHKPEMAIALTVFEGLCGFRPKDEIVRYFEAIPELQSIIGNAVVEEFKKSANQEQERASLQKCFTLLMTCDTDTLNTQLSSLITRIQDMENKKEDTTHLEGELLLRLNSQFPGDIGCFVVYFLNHMTLQPGEAMFLEANLPHAYLSGDCMECMACSDNVVRSGLTPKFKDVSVLCDMLNYSCKPAEDNKFVPRGSEQDPFIQVYNPPVPDFTVARIQLPANQKQYQLEAIDSGSIVLVVEGAASISPSSEKTQIIELKKGSVLFIGANEKLAVDVKDGSMLMFRAYCQL